MAFIEVDRSVDRAVVPGVHTPPNPERWQYLAREALSARKLTATRQTRFASAHATTIITHPFAESVVNASTSSARPVTHSLPFRYSTVELNRRRSLLRQRGFALMLVLLLVSVGLGAAVFSFINSNATTLARDQITVDALNSVKTALIAYAVSAARPGEFPCPDFNQPGNALSGVQNGTCGGAGVALGRVPWKTLGIPEPKDSSGETLWYAVATPFRRTQPGSLPINSDTRGNLTVFSADGVTPLTSEAVAVVFAPGPALGGQTRGGANQTVAANYLETSSGINNADTVAPTGPFIAGRLRVPNNPNYNDRLLYITTREFIPAVEMRVGKEIIAALDGYRANSSCGCYPWADTWPLSDSISDRGVN